MAEQARDGVSRPPAPRLQTFGIAAASARQALSWFWTRESLLRLALSFVLSVALWLYITGKQDPGLAQEFPQPLPIDVVNLDRGVSVTTNVSTVRVRYRSDAPGAIVTSVNFHPIVSVSGMQSGTSKSVPVQVIPDPGLHVVQVIPSQILVTLDRIESRDIQVTPTILTPAPKGYTSGAIRVVPRSIRVQGPHSLVSEISSSTIEIDLAGVTATLDNSYKPVLLNSEGEPVSGSSRIQVNPPQVQVHVPVTALSSSKSLPILVPLQGQVKPGYRVVSLTSSPAEITAKGSPARLSRITEASTVPVRLAGRKVTFNLHLPIRLAPGLTSSTHAALVTVGIQPISTK